ncbi:MAG: hypothetical protein FJX62_23555, partial [Alphaproteobacteria bacterium]|nr:hypothetical protein [Alphaproteobacteria bacterium]
MKPTERTIYKHARKGRWRFRYRRKAGRDETDPKPASQRCGLKARDPAGEARALAACEDARAVAQATLKQAIARRDTALAVRELSAQARAL